VLLRQRQEVQALSRSLNAESPGADRILDWDGVINARDSGGLATAAGTIRRGGLVRSGVLNNLTPTGVAALTELGVRTVVDVRNADEIADHWDRYPLREHPVVGYRNMPFRAGLDEERREKLHAAWDAAQSRDEMNRLDLEYNHAGIAGIVGAIADAPPGGVLVHCHAGKDRTGVVVALTLSAVGVSDEDIADDYALTQLSMAPIMEEWFAYIGATDDERPRLWTLADPSREAMLGTLQHLHERYGGARAYLLAAGVTEEQLERLRDRLVAAS
jgi:protein-tyrosine phosphatase